MIGLIIEPVRGAEILRERSYLAQPGGGIERERTDIHTIGHLGGVEVNGLARHQLFRQRKHIAVQAKQIAHGVVVLEPVQAPRRVGLGHLTGCRRAQQGLERGEHFRTYRGREGRLVLGRHVAGIEHINEFFNQRRFSEELAGVGNLLEVDLALHLVAAVAFDAMLGKHRLQLLPEIIGALSGQPCERENQKAHAKARGRGGNPV